MRFLLECVQRPDEMWFVDLDPGTAILESRQVYREALLSNGKGKKEKKWKGKTKTDAEVSVPWPTRSCPTSLERR